MATGTTNTGSLADSVIEDWNASARIKREFVGVMSQLADKATLGEGIGTTWNEVALEQLEAQSVTEATDLEDNPQQIEDSTISITPTIVGIYVVITDRVKQRMSKVALGQMGGLVQNAVQRKKDLDGITVLDSATTSLCGAGSTLTTGHISAASSRITSNETEAGMPPLYFVGHGYQLKDLADELVAGVGTYGMTDGPTADVFKNKYNLVTSGVDVYEDGNIPIDASDDAKGGVWAKRAIVLVQGRAPRVETKREPGKGGGADGVYHYDEYAYGERGGGSWLYEIYSDATAPTS